MRCVPRTGCRWRSGPRSGRPTAVIRTRVAVDTGEAVERDGDYFGPAVNRVARLRGAAHGGEVVVSVATAAIVSGALPAGWELVDVGTVELRGLGPQSAFLLSAPDLDPIQRRRPTPDGGVSRREAEVLDLVVDSRTNAEIAAALFISERTVESHVSSLLRKLDASDRRDLVRRARTRPAPEAPVSAALLPPALELLADPAGFVGRVAERDAPPRSMATRGRPGTPCWWSWPPRRGWARAASSPSWRPTCTPTVGGCCSVPASRTWSTYGPFAQAIADAVDGGAVDVPVEVASVLPGAVRTAAPRPDDLAAPAAVIDGIRHWLTTAAASTPTLLVIEDLHWSTATTREVFANSCARPAGAPARRGYDPRHGPGPRPRTGDVDRRHGTIACRHASGSSRPRPPRGRRARGRRGRRRRRDLADTGGNPLLITHVTADGHAGSLSASLGRRATCCSTHGLETCSTLRRRSAWSSTLNLLAVGCGVPLLDVLESLEEQPGCRTGCRPARPARPVRIRPRAVPLVSLRLPSRFVGGWSYTCAAAAAMADS